MSEAGRVGFRRAGEHMLFLKRYDWLVLPVILLAAFGLRVINLDDRSLWYDEAFSVFFARQGWEAMVDGTLGTDDDEAAEEHPLLYYELLHLWMRVFGESPQAVRMLSVLFGVLTVGLVYGLSRELFGRLTACVAAGILAVAPFHVQYSQEVRMYALLALLLVGTTWLYWRAIHAGRVYLWLAFGVSAGLAMHVQQLAAFYLLALALLPVLRRDWRSVWRTGLAGLVALLVYLPWLVHLPRQLDKLERYWVEKPNVLHIWLALRSFVSVNLDFSSEWWLPTFLLAALLATVLIYRGVGFWRDKCQPTVEREGVLWTLWLAFVPIVSMWVASHVLYPVFLPRALLPSAVAFYIALAWMFARGGIPLPVRGVLVAAWAVVIVYGLATHYSWDSFPNGRFQDAIRVLEVNWRPGERIVHGNKITGLPMVYYGEELPQHYVRDIPDIGSDTLAPATQQMLGFVAEPCVATAAAGAAIVWYVAFEQFAGEMENLVAEDPDLARYDSLGWLQAHYAAVERQSVGDLDLYRFTGPDSVARQAQCP